eukprot:11997151-Alexandrium_andersonii.AAC.1
MPGGVQRKATQVKAACAHRVWEWPWPSCHGVGFRCRSMQWPSVRRAACSVRRLESKQPVRAVSYRRQGFPA